MQTLEVITIQTKNILTSLNFVEYVNFNMAILFRSQSTLHKMYIMRRKIKLIWFTHIIWVIWFTCNILLSWSSWIFLSYFETYYIKYHINNTFYIKYNLITFRSFIKLFLMMCYAVACRITRVGTMAILYGSSFFFLLQK